MHSANHMKVTACTENELVERAPLAAANILFMAMFMALSGERLIYEHNDSKLLQPR